MKVTKITFEQLFPTGMYANQRLGVEVEITDGDWFDFDEKRPKTTAEVTKEAFSIAKKIVNDSFSELNPNIQEQPVFEEGTMFPIQNPRPTERNSSNTISELIADINSCTEVKTLEAYRLLVKKDPAMQFAYDRKMEQLTEK